MTQIKTETGKWTTTMKRKNTGARLRDLWRDLWSRINLDIHHRYAKICSQCGEASYSDEVAKKIRKNYWLVAFDNHWSCGCWLSLCGITKRINLHQNLRAALRTASDFELSAIGSSVSKTIREGVYHKRWNLLRAEKEKTTTLRKSILQNFSGLPG